MKTSKALLLTSLLLILIFASLLLGSASLSPVELISTEIGKTILFHLRLPRVIGAIIGGIALSVAGLLIQVGVNNSLASPNLIGVNGGAGFFVLIMLALFPKSWPFLPLFAFVGALLASALVLGISKSVGGTKSSLILGGVMTGALFNAGISTVSSLKPDVLGTYSAFSIGGFSGLYLQNLIVPSIGVLLALVITFIYSKPISYLLLGDDIASSLGINVNKTRTIAVILGAALSACAVSFCGLLGFVGLMVPHGAKAIVGEDVKKRLIASLILGPILTLVADLLGRIIISPSELPAGVFLALVGVPFFFVLLKRRKEW